MTDSSLSDSQIDALLTEHDGYRRAATLMREHGWRQADIARRLGVHRLTVHRWFDEAYAQRNRDSDRDRKRRYREEARKS